MPMLDVTEVLLDPMFCELMTVVRREATVGTDGMNIITETVLNPIGVVTIGSIEKYALDPDAISARNFITVHCTMRLIGAATNALPDIVTWSGNNYVVRKPYNWSKYGAGFYAADCEMTDLQTEAPEAWPVP